LDEKKALENENSSEASSGMSLKWLKLVLKLLVKDIFYSKEGSKAVLYKVKDLLSLMTKLKVILSPSWYCKQVLIEQNLTWLRSIWSLQNGQMGEVFVSTD